MPHHAIAISNQKGGVGKTTTAVNLGACLAAAGRRCLVVDLDPQANATAALGVPRGAGPGVKDVLLGACPAKDAVRVTALDRLDLLPAEGSLAEIEKNPPADVDYQTVLARALALLEPAYDFLFIDCPPTQGPLCSLALSAADSIIVPIQCESFALDALSHILFNINNLQKERGGAPALRGILCTMFDERLDFAHAMVKEVRDRYGAEVFRSMIPRDITLSEAATFGQPILMYDPTCRGSIGYIKLAKEVLTDEGKAARQRVGFPPRRDGADSPSE